MESLPSPISCILVLNVVLLVTSNFSYTSATELIVEGKLGESRSSRIIRFSPVEREIKLICHVEQTDITNSSSPKWNFISDNKANIADVAERCGGNYDNSSLINENPLLSDCDVSFDQNKLQLVLELDDINENEFGDYVCQSGSRNRNQTFTIKQLVHLTRTVKKDKKKKIEKSDIVTVGFPLFLFCNESGLSLKHHKVSWKKDGVDITAELVGGLGLFENFTKTKTDKKSLAFEGIARLEHRGNYTCEVDLLSKPGNADDDILKIYYPVSFSFFVRVKDGEEWKLPTYILVGEIVLIGLFTLIVNQREKGLKDGEIICDDSDDEDDVPTTSNANGTQNNNSNGK